MTLPASGTITLAQIAAEFGLASTAVFPTAFYGKGGAPASGTLRFSDFYGRSGVTFNPVGGTYNQSDGGLSQAQSFTITATAAVVWTWSKTGSAATCNVVSGNSATSITFTVGVGTSDRSATFTVSAGGKNWTITISTTGDGGGVGATMTL